MGKLMSRWWKKGVGIFHFINVNGIINWSMRFRLRFRALAILRIWFQIIIPLIVNLSRKFFEFFAAVLSSASILSFKSVFPTA